MNASLSKQAAAPGSRLHRSADPRDFPLASFPLSIRCHAAREL